MGYRRDNRMWQAGYDYYKNFIATQTVDEAKLVSWMEGYDEGWAGSYGEGVREGRRQVFAMTSSIPKLVKVTGEATDLDGNPIVLGSKPTRPLDWGPQPHNPGRPVAVVRTPGPGDPPPAKPGDVVTFTLRQTAVESDHHFTD